MDILLIRHGETEISSPETFSKEKNRPDPPLNARGRHQAERLGRRLEGSGIQRIFTSDLARAAETAEIANSRLHVPVEKRAELREIDMGRLHFVSWEDIRAEDPALYKAWHRHAADMPYPEGECGGDAAARAMKVVEEIIGSGLEKVAIVTHGGIIRILACVALGIGQEKRFLFGPPENTSVSTIKYTPAGKEFSIEALNDTSHLLNL